MESIAVPEVCWTKGYNGGPARFIDKDTIVYACGNNITFLKESGISQVFTSPGEGVSTLDVHPLNKLYAFSEFGLKPRVFIYKYPNFERITTLTDGAELEFSHLAFSTSDYLVTISGIPDFKLKLWNHTTGQCLLTADIPQVQITSLSVNPGNWRQICVTTVESLVVITSEQNDTYINALNKTVKLFVDTKESISRASVGKTISLTEAQSMMQLEYKLKPSSIAGLFDPEATQFEDHRDPRFKCVPVCHTWTPIGDIIIGCEQGQLLKLDGEKWDLKSLYIPQIARRESLRDLQRGSSLLSREMSILEEDHTSMSEDTSAENLNTGSLSCMILHKRGLYAGGKDGVLRCINISSDDAVSLKESYNIGASITSLSFSTTWNRLNVGSDSGSMFIYDIDKLTAKELLRDCAGALVSVQMIAPGLEHAVTLRENGYLQVWSLDTGEQVAMAALGLEITAVVSAPLAPLVLMGTSSGYIFACDLTDIIKPKIIHRIRVFDVPITRITYSHNGKLVLMGCSTGNIVMMSGLASDQFKMMASLKCDGAIESITTHEYDSNIQVVISSNNTGDITHGANKCSTFTLTPHIINSIEEYYSSLKAELQLEAINFMIFNYASPSYGACLIGQDILYSMAQDNKKLQKLVVPKEKPKKPNSKDSYLLPEHEYNCHQLSGGKLILSHHGKWLASVGYDGQLQIRTTSEPSSFSSAHPHDYRHGGIKSAVWSADSQWILTVGREDGMLCCYRLNFVSGESESRSALTASKSYHQQSSDVIMKERDALKDMSEFNMEDLKSDSAQSVGRSTAIGAAIDKDEIYQTPTPVPKLDTTWLEARQLLAHTEEDKIYADTKKDIRFEIREIRRTLQGLMENNKMIPDIEQLQHNEFDLDVDEQHRLQELGDSEVAKIRSSMEMENLAKQYLAHLIKQECWDSMEIKGRSIEAFSTPLEVQNYPMKARTREELDELSRVIAAREVEMAERKARESLIEIAIPKTSSNQASGGGEDGADEEEVDVDTPSITGSMGSAFGGKSDLFYNQFELHSRDQKINQIILLKDAIFRIKNVFNKEFDDVYAKKEQELVKITEKCKRIEKIHHDIGVKDKVNYHTLSTKENPELLLTVADSEVKVEKYLTPEQRKAKEEFEKAEEERKKRERGDNARERALEMMMGGVLEIKKEDELKKDVPIPPFMQAKEEADWTEDEQKASKEYERKCKELNEEREKYRKQLEAELKKLQLMIAEAELGFNEQLKALFTKRLKVEMVICQEELKIVRLQWDLMFQHSLEIQEKQLEAEIEHQKTLKQLAAESYIVARKNVDNFKEGYDILVAEDKVMDKGFKREFSDLTALQLEQMYKLFRKRPRGTKALHNRGETPILDPNSGNPFAERPSTARVNAMQKQAIETALQDLDKFNNAPEGVDEITWQRLVKYRRVKIESEQLVKQKALVMAEMMSFQQKRLDEDFKIAEEIENLSQELMRLKTSIERLHLNLQIQLLMKQGQVELDAGTFIHDYEDSVLIHRSVVEDLNGNIKSLGESKIASMMESKDFRKGIIQLEWEHKKNLMKVEDLRKKMRTISNMKVTREIQAYLNEIDHNAKISQDVNLLEQTILLQKKHHEANVELKKRQLSELGKVVKDKDYENRFLLSEIEELNVSVNERQHIFDANADKNIDAIRERRYQEIVQRRKLVDLAKAQANEVAVLRAEVERLRMRTFPALVQVER